ncbi:type IV pilus assembly protein PilM [Diaminobutyricibacter tongyongensis]|uniref:Type IV pilus assembly protein PilM n=1 Tax=Leifsonia tongyongensis TaxID=1268043 RepID=A0A6L9XSZ7_9MICO|nr:type IV pilus assembly protein PilM [Diaminobutyricibacter tongyongensis]NEN04499.1 type IV pilus assembly protein PilM [Diaminobutyricibacter tongyongensis]
MAKTIVGVDIGSSTLRAVEVADADKARPTLLRYHELDVPDGAVSRGEVLEPNTVGTLLKQLWSAGGFKSKRVVLGMGNQRVLARDLSVPSAPRERIRESLPFIVQDMLPVPVQDALLDFYPISETIGEHGPMTNGLLIAAVKDAVLGNVRAAQLAGLTPVDVDLIPFALDRVLLSRTKSRGTVALVDVGANTTSVIVASNGIPQFVRIIPTGGAEVTSALAARLEVPFEDAEKLKRAYGLATTVSNAEEQRVVSTIYEVVSELLTSLRNTISYFSNTRPTDPVTHIVVTGRGSLLPGFTNVLAEFTRIPVNLGDPFGAVAISRNLSADDLRGRQTSIAVALGLAMRSVSA